MTTLLTVIFPVFLIVGVAALAQHWLALDLRTLSRTAFDLAVPALILDVLWRPDLDVSMFGQIALGTILVSLILWLLHEGAARLWGFSPSLRATFVVAALLTNAGAYGLPVIGFAFGDPGLVPASAYLITFNVAMIFLAGVYLSSMGEASVGQAARHLFGQPFVYAALIGGITRFAGLSAPEPLVRAVGLLGQAGRPLLLVVLGLQLRRSLETGWKPRYLPALGLLCVSRFLIAPLLAGWIGGGLLGMSGVTYAVFVVDNALPTAILTTVLATEFEADAAFATWSVIVTTLVSLLTVTLWINYLT
jgi:predicted permease